MRMIKALNSARLDSGIDGRTADTSASRSALLLARASLVALCGAVFAQPAYAQSVATPPSIQQDAPGDEVAGGAPDSSERAADGSSDEMITVTGTRIANNRNSPTPITAVAADDMAATTPSDVADGLNKLPQIIGGRTPRTQGNGSTNNGGNVLSLRNFGPSRTLVLLDGHRVPASNQDGTATMRVGPAEFFLTVNNVFNARAPLFPSNSGIPGLFYPTLGFHDDMGRFYTLGVRAKL